MEQPKIDVREKPYPTNYLYFSIRVSPNTKTLIFKVISRHPPLLSLSTMFNNNLQPLFFFYSFSFRTQPEVVR
ncbi:hypothetical protein Hanom_Chr04g00319251 [Helianthus anomalus]